LLLAIGRLRATSGRQLVPQTCVLGSLVVSRPTLLVDSVAFVDALKAADGNLSAAAVELKMTRNQLVYCLRTHPKLQARLDEIRRTREVQRRNETISVLEKHRGNIEAAARDVDIATSSFSDRVARLGLTEIVRHLRPKPPTRAKEKRVLLDALERHHGQLYRIERELKIAKGTLRARLIKHDLVAKADALRAEYNRIGPRSKLPTGTDFDRRRTKLLRLIESCGWNLSNATHLAGVSPATFYKNMRILKIDRQRDQNGYRLRQIVDALRQSRGILVRAAASIGCTEKTLRRWCVEFDVSPRDYR